ncbi:MAG TPA: hypothetical protein PLZ21_08550 [Armatimonadota bacterium]|jgi:late competence protein required for DNA uptake (superfamily II DNA/RNA helicase)|nr:hypothetical protein [Armatimonadota bacterium]HOM70700.1 hypothetical protein [Armatimonadota bacterium]HOP80596.1 hypothetical protein [Armatimonadota bacterium]
MLITIVEAVSCENPRCSQFAKQVKLPSGIRTYYCQVCGSINQVRGIDASVVFSPERYKEYLKQYSGERMISS